MAEYRGLGFDPVPGSADAVTAAGERCRRAAEHVDAAARDLLGIPDWQGRAAEAFTARTEAAAHELTAAPSALRRAADILDDWADTLAANQREADGLDRRALELRRMIDAADDSVAAANRALQVAIGSAARTAQAEHLAALARRTQLEDQLTGLLERARALEHDHTEAARRAADQLRAVDAGDLAEGVPTVDGLFGGIAHALGDLSTRAGELAMTLLGPPVQLPTARTGAAAVFAGALAAIPGATAAPGSFGATGPFGIPGPSTASGSFGAPGPSGITGIPGPLGPSGPR